MAMGTPRPPRRKQAAPSGPVGFAAALALEQILGAVAGLGGRMEERVIALEGRMMEGMAALAADADARAARMKVEVERLEVGLRADAGEKEARLMAKLLAVDAVEQELAEKAKWEVKQWEDLAGLMRLRREDIKEVKQAVDAIGAELGGRCTTRPPPIPLAPAPEAMEGVVTTVPAMVSAPQEDAIEEWSDMVGVEREGLFALLHAPELGMSSAPEPVAPAAKEEEEKKKKDKGKAKAGRVAVPPPARKQKGSPRQQHRQAAVNEARAQAAAVAKAQAPSILKRPETAAAEKKAEEERKEEAVKAEEKRKKEAAEKEEEKAVAMARWETGELSQAEWGTYTMAANPIKDLAGDSEALEEVAAEQRIAHRVGMRALGDQWEEERARARAVRQTLWP